MSELATDGKERGQARAEASLPRKVLEFARQALSQLLELLLPSPDGPRALEIRSITEQFFLTLRASFLRVPEPAAGDSQARRVWERAAKLVARGEERATWDDNYQLEQYLADLYEPEVLRAELEVRTLEAKRVLRPALADWYAKALAELDGPADPPRQDLVPARRALLGRLVNDLQWRYKIRESIRGYKQQISRDTAIAFAFAIVLFVIVLFFGLDADGSEGASTTSGVDPRAATGDVDERGLAGVMLLAAVTGAFGASFSMLLNSGRRLAKGGLDDLKLLASRWVLLSRVLVGCGAAVVLLFFLYGGLLAGSAFPEVASVEVQQGLKLRGLALLVFWCFLSGFSETLVPALLSRMDRKATSDESPGSRPELAPDGAGKGNSPSD